MSAEAPVKKKVAILGGGVGSIVTAFSLTSQPGWQDRFDITVYQMGWRIGGKGASGRNPDVFQRIEEHGLHIWLGFYENAFAAMRACYDELKRPKGSPLAGWQDAFKKHVDVGFMEKVGDAWSPWMFHFPVDDRVPGDPGGPPLPALWTYVKTLVEWIFGHLASLGIASVANDIGTLHEQDWLEQTFSELGQDVHSILDDLSSAGLEAGAAMAHLAKKLTDLLSDDPRQHSSAHHQALDRMLEELIAWLEKKVAGVIESDPVLRRGYILIGLSVAMVKGMIDDGVIFHGFSVIERYEWIQWLKKHGATDYLATSPPVRGLYDLVFAFEKGKLDKPNYAAGTAMRSIFSILLDWKGAIFWKMQAGMGDTVFGPYYEVLVRRGVRFEYFHKVEELRLSDDGATVESIRMGRQVALKDATPDSTYQPLVDVLGLPCWPSFPLWDQLDPEQVREIRAQNVDLESYYADWKPVEIRTLRRGVEFDVAVLGIPPGAHRFIAPDLLRLPQWQAMVDHVLTVQTQAQQLWIRPDLAALGWKGPSPVVDAYEDPMNTWADMSQLIVRETWPEGSVGNVAYFCGPFEDSTEPSPPPAPNPEFPRRALAEVTESSIRWTEDNARSLWPNAVPTGKTTGFDWSLLATKDESLRGVARARAQYHRVNVEPSERYVLSLAGSAQYRLRADRSGVENLVLAGDWTDNGFLNAGCVEAATMSGLQAARAIDGIARAIVGEPPGWWKP